MAYSTKTKKPKDKTVIMIAVGKMKPKKNGRKTKSNRNFDSSAKTPIPSKQHSMGCVFIGPY